MFAIVTDSTAYLTRNEAEKHNVHIVPMTYISAGKSYNETFTDANGSFEKMINSGRWSTSQPAVAAFTGKFEELLGENSEILCIVISSRLSGTYSSASIAAREVNPEKVIVVDSLSTSGGLMMLVKKARELSDQNIPLQEAAQIIEQMRNNISIVFSVDKMDALRRSGRLGIVRQSISTILNIRPILKLQDGAIISHSMSRGKPDQINKMVAEIPADAKSLVINFFGSLETVENLISVLRKKFPDIEPEICRVGPILGIHLGLTAIGVAWDRN